MKITFAGQVLADDAALQWCSGDTLAADRGVSLDEYPQADYATPRDLGNATVQYAFSAFKSHATLRAAQVYYLTHGQEATGQGDAVLATEGNAQTRYLRDAICTARAASLRGLSTLFEYTLLGTLVTGLVAGGLQSTSILRTPDIIPEDTAILELPHLASSSDLATPGVADSGADTMAAGALASSSTLNAPALSAQASGTLAAGDLATISVLSAPSINDLISAGDIASVSTLSAPALSAQANGTMAAGALASSSVLSAPAILEPQYFLDLDGTNDYISTPDSPENSVTGDLELIIRAAAADWTPTSTRDLISKYEQATGQRQFVLAATNANQLVVTLSANGTAFESVTSGSIAGWTNGSAYWIRVTYTAATGAVSFEYATTAQFPSSWTALSNSGPSSILGLNDSDAPLILGSRHNFSSSRFDGKIYEAYVYDGIGGTLVARFDAADGTDPTFNNVAGQTAWTNSGATPGSD